MAKPIIWRGKNNSLKIRDDCVQFPGHIRFVHIYTVLAKDGLSWTFEIRFRRGMNICHRVRGHISFVHRCDAQAYGEEHYKKMSGLYQVGIYQGK